MNHSVKISVDPKPEKSPYTNGDVISGNVWVGVSWNSDIRNIEVSLTGKCLIHRDKRFKSTLHSEVPFLDSTVTVYSKSSFCPFKETSQNFPFQIKIPDKYKRYAAEVPLPPSIWTPNFVNISYEVIAKVDGKSSAIAFPEIEFLPTAPPDTPSVEKQSPTFQSIPKQAKQVLDSNIKLRPMSLNHQERKESRKSKTTGEDIFLEFSIKPPNILLSQQFFDCQIIMFTSNKSLASPFFLEGNNKNTIKEFEINRISLKIAHQVRIYCGGVRKMSSKCVDLLDRSFSSANFRIAHFELNQDGAIKRINMSALLDGQKLYIPKEVIPDFNFNQGVVDVKHVLQAEIHVVILEKMRVFKVSHPIKVEGYSRRGK